MTESEIRVLRHDIRHWSAFDHHIGGHWTVWFDMILHGRRVQGSVTVSSRELVPGLDPAARERHIYDLAFWRFVLGPDETTRRDEPQDIVSIPMSAPTDHDRRFWTFYDVIGKAVEKAVSAAFGSGHSDG